jgi:hypothetical protein
MSSWSPPQAGRPAPLADRAVLPCSAPAGLQASSVGQGAGVDSGEARTDDPDPHATLQLAALHHGIQVAGWTASCRLASGKGAPAMPETVEVIVLGLETTAAEGFLTALEQLR